MTDETTSSARPLVIGAGFVAVVVAALFFAQSQSPSDEISAPAIPVADVAAPVDDVPVVANDQAALDDMSEETALAAEELAPRNPEPPRFDTFRVEVDGSMVIAGQAEPGQTIDIVLGGEVLESVVADNNGAFVAFPLAGASDTPRRLSLVADPDGAATVSDTTYIVAPIVAPALLADAEVEPPTVSAEVSEDAEESIAAATPSAPTVLQADQDGVTVVQSGARPEAEDVNVALDAITYDPEGEVQLSGRATSDGAIQVYIDNEPVTASPVTEGGDWRIDLPEIDTGVYTLRIDEVDDAGQVVSRLETPFKREEPEEVAAVLAEKTAEEGFEVAVRTVQPGATLWAIAEESLGNGIFYVEVFEANADLIRDPDLIYPGQIFRMPNMDQ
ncbi:MAG: peptidoglycan-binding protein [Pseudomonadota bacterium]